MALLTMEKDTGIYFIDGHVIAESGDVRVYQDNYDTYLELGPRHNLWALASEQVDYKEQINNKPKGKCLEVGLGLGVASNYILSCKKVKNLTTIEKNGDVIKVYNKIECLIEENINFFAARKEHKIINDDGLSYVKKARKQNVLYDYIFLDFYSLLDEETLPIIEEMVYECKKILRYGGRVDGWWDKYSPDKFTIWFNEIFGCQYVSK